MSRMVLAITVGGEPDPVVHAVNHHRPDFVVFFVTTEPSGGSRRFLVERTEKGDSILARTGLGPERYEIITLPHPDDLDDCFRRMHEALLEHQEYGERLADYTGGTKTMSAALVLAALFQGWKPSLVSGPRRNTIKIVSGTEVTQRVRAALVSRELILLQVEKLYRQHEYAGAEGILEAYLRATELSEREQGVLSKLVVFLRALSAWDRFVYDRALELLRSVPTFWPEGCRFLSRIWEQGGLRFRAVGDLVGNALRRADQGRFEDAILRLYRAVELLAQLRLDQAHALDTKNLDLQRLNLSQLPPDLAAQFRQRKESDGRAWAGLLDAYRLLEALKDPLGTLFSERRERLSDLLSLRNQLFLVHGDKAVEEKDWQRAKGLVLEFLKQAQEVLDVEIDPVRFPAWEKLPLG